MTSLPPFAIELRQDSYRDATVLYQDAGRTLEIRLEMSGVPQYDFVGLDSAFAFWTTPPQVAIGDADQATIRARIEAWAASRHLRLGFGPALFLEDMIREAVANGFEVSSRGRDDEDRETITLTRVRPPPGSLAPNGGLFTRLKGWLRR